MVVMGLPAYSSSSVCLCRSSASLPTGLTFSDNPRSFCYFLFWWWCTPVLFFKKQREKSFSSSGESGSGNTHAYWCPTSSSWTAIGTRRLFYCFAPSGIPFVPISFYSRTRQGTYGSFIKGPSAYWKTSGNCWYLYFCSRCKPHTCTNTMQRFPLLSYGSQL